MVRLSYPQVSAIDGRVQGRAVVLVDVVEEALLRVTCFLGWRSTKKKNEM